MTLYGIVSLNAFELTCQRYEYKFWHLLCIDHSIISSLFVCIHKIFMMEMASRTVWIVQKRARNAISWKGVSEVLSIGTSYICCKRVTSLITNLSAHLKGQKHAELYAQRIAFQFLTSLPQDIHAGNGQPYCLNCSKKSKECHILKRCIWSV